MWQLDRHRHLKYEFGDTMEIGDVVGIEHDWVESFPLLPRRTVGGEWVWLKRSWVRRVWVYTGFIDEPETQWGTIFDVLRTS